VICWSAIVGVGTGAVAVGKLRVDEEPPAPLDVPPPLHAASATTLTSNTLIPN
jgi:hypothetical protein